MSMYNPQRIVKFLYWLVYLAIQHDDEGYVKSLPVSALQCSEIIPLVKTVNFDVKIKHENEKCTPRPKKILRPQSHFYNHSQYLLAK